MKNGTFNKTVLHISCFKPKFKTSFKAKHLHTFHCSFVAFLSTKWLKTRGGQLKSQVLQLHLLAQINQSEAAAEGGTLRHLCVGESIAKRAVTERLPPRVCCRSCIWRRWSWRSGRRQNGGRWQDSWSPHRESCCRRAGESEQSLAWRTCSRTDMEKEPSDWACCQG